METFIRVLKAVGITLVIIALAALAVTLLIWTKGLLMLLVLFSAMVYVIYTCLTHRANTMRKEDRKWL